MTHKRGFTLIELVVALALFMLITDITVSMFVMVVRHQKRILAQQQMLNEVSFAKEKIITALRDATPDTANTCRFTGTYAGSQRVWRLSHLDIATGMYQGVQFMDHDGVCREFFLDQDGIFRERQGLQLPRPLLSESQKFSYARFLVNPLSTPRLTMALAMESQNNGNAKQYIFQTTTSWRGQ